MGNLYVVSVRVRKTHRSARQVRRVLDLRYRDILSHQVGPQSREIGCVHGKKKSLRLRIDRMLRPQKHDVASLAVQPRPLDGDASIVVSQPKAQQLIERDRSLDLCNMKHWSGMSYPFCHLRPRSTLSVVTAFAV